MKSKSADKQAGEVVGICKPYIPRPITGQIDFSSSVFSWLVRRPNSPRGTNYPVCIGMTIREPLHGRPLVPLELFFNLLIYHMVFPPYFRSIRCAWLNFRSNTWSLVNLETESRVEGIGRVTGRSTEETWKKPQALLCIFFSPMSLWNKITKTNELNYLYLFSVKDFDNKYAWILLGKQTFLVHENTEVPLYCWL